MKRKVIQLIKKEKELCYPYDRINDFNRLDDDELLFK